MPPSIARSLRCPASSSSTPPRPAARSWRGLAAAPTCPRLIGPLLCQDTPAPSSRLVRSGCSPAGTRSRSRGSNFLLDSVLPWRLTRHMDRLSPILVCICLNRCSLMVSYMLRYLEPLPDQILGSLLSPPVIRRIKKDKNKWYIHEKKLSTKRYSLHEKVLSSVLHNYYILTFLSFITDIFCIHLNFR